MADPAGPAQAFEDTTDYANYFVTYGYLYHQKQMLEDHTRMISYRDAILRNRDCFEGAVVLDVGAGSGVLGIWAAQAGARKVYAVEATDAAKFARKVVEHNGLAGKVEVIQAKMEDVTLPEKVDVIVSEWMGYMLLRESMLDSVLEARDKWLKPGGALYPSKATMYFAPIRTAALAERSVSYAQTMQEWHTFAGYMKNEHGISVDCLTGAYDQEHKIYYMRTSQWASLRAEEVVGSACEWFSFDVATVTIEELKTKVQAPFSCKVGVPGVMHALAGWFDVQFEGSAAKPASSPVTLSTAPHVGYTHWGQQVFLLAGEVAGVPGDVLEGEASLVRQERNQRTLKLDLTYSMRRGPQGSSRAEAPTQMHYLID
mmetsp:Transcript_22488/g.60839  ORF Transcript_22488/g.60839 Transcript_22488/m.60839 type:complete len:371 (-) Transcript_22488:562-1674(-)